MATPVFSPSAFTTGEIAPALFGHTDLARFHSGAATMRNMFPRITGGAYSRAGTKFINFSGQQNRQWPPRLVSFQFSILQGRILEFGNHYLRVFANGAPVTDVSLNTAAATNNNPLTVTIPSTGGLSATPINSGVYASYAPGNTVTLAGGTYSIPASILVNTTLLLSINPQQGVGTGYAPGDTVNLLGGTQATQSVVTVSSTQVNSLTVVSAGTGGVTGLATITGTTGTGIKFNAQVNIVSGAIASVLSISYGGNYTVNPANVAVEPVTGGGLTGATVALGMGPNTLTITNPGVFTANPGNTMLQGSTSGSGSGAVFVNPLMGVNSAGVAAVGSYTVLPSNPVSQAYSSGGGLGVEFNMGWSGGGGAGSVFNVGDWISFEGVGGMTELNGNTFVVSDVAGDVYTFVDTFGQNVDATSWGVYSSGGTASRIYTVYSPYGEEDLKWMKFTQSADVMSICCVNQDTQAEYPPYDLKRYSDTNWVFDEVNLLPTISPPGYCWLTPSYNWAILSILSGFDKYPNPITASYAYCVTAVNQKDGTESVASPVGSVVGAVDISSSQGSITVNFPAVPGAQQYNIYKAQPNISWGYFPNPVPIGSLFGFAGTSLGGAWVDDNVVPDYAQSPPTHKNPFARGAITQVNVTNGGAGYQWGTTVTINSTTGSGAVIIPIIQNGGYTQSYSGFAFLSNANGPIVGFLVADAGQGYLPTDTVTINSSTGAGATASIVTAPQSGTYPALPAYYQQRRIYASTLNSPDTYWMSVVGAYTNFDTRIPTIESDAIEGTPWTQQVDGIQWMIPMPGGVITLTGSSAWLVSGNGSSPLNPQPIGPESQQAQPQMFNGASPYVPPVRIDWDVIFVQSKGSIYRDFSLNNYFVNYYTGSDITVNSPHLFFNYKVVEHAWCEEPYKLLWSVRSDGAMLSMTYYKPEKVLGWARHDTFGQFLSVASVTEPPVDALYMVVLRPIGPGSGCALCIERMDNRLWPAVEDVWAVDSALSYPQPEPAATLAISTPDGNGKVVGFTNLEGGTGYSASTQAYIVDNNGIGPGSGAAVSLNITGGVITGINLLAGGAGYTYPQLVIDDLSGQGQGASATPLLQTQAAFQTNTPVFSPASIGSVIRAAGGIATITNYVSDSEVYGDYVVPASSFMPELMQGTYVPNVTSGNWTLTEPAQVIGGLNHLTGLDVTGLADGQVVTPRTVDAKGQVTLDTPATSIVLGLAFTPQLQSMYVDVGEPTVQGQRKKVGAVTARMDASRDFLIGSNQTDGSTLAPIQLAPDWNGMEPAPNLSQAPYSGGQVPLWTGDVRIPVSGGVGKPGQVALMQENPLPMNVLAIIPEVMPGDTPEQKAAPRRRGGGGQQG